MFKVMPGEGDGTEELAFFLTPSSLMTFRRNERSQDLSLQFED
jgi:hypothetical protein